MPSKPRVLIIVQGGLVTEVITDVDATIIIKDFDNIECGDKLDVEGNDQAGVTAAEFDRQVVADLQPDQLENSNAAPVPKPD